MYAGTGTGFIGALLLIALAQGYTVLRKADKEKGAMRRIGLVIGFVIIVLSGATVINKCLLTLVNLNASRQSCCPVMKGCGMMIPHQPMPHHVVK